MPDYCTFQEYVGRQSLLIFPITVTNTLFQHLMDEHLALLKPDNISLDQAASIGVGAEVSYPDTETEVLPFTRHRQHALA